MGILSHESPSYPDPAELDRLRGHAIDGAVSGCLMVVRVIQVGDHFVVSSIP
jgi:hypothetical protein